MPADAQTHPCDVNYGTNFRITSGNPASVTISGCELPQMQTDGFRLYLTVQAPTIGTTAPTLTVNALLVTAMPNAAGKFQYSGQGFITNFVNGNYTAWVTALNTNGLLGVRQESTPVGPFTLDVVSPPPPIPDPPSNIRLTN